MLVPPVPVISISRDAQSLVLLDQRALPGVERYVEVRTLDELVHAICTLTVRGAPAIGVAAALGVAIVYRNEGAPGRERLRAIVSAVRAARPTAVNLFWATEQLLRSTATEPESAVADRLLAAAERLRADDVARCLAIGEAGVPLLASVNCVLTHCNAGALATAGIGTALAPVYVAHARGQTIRVYADETRPLLQGARLTAWELARAGIPVTVIPDGAAASLLAAGTIDAVLVGADRIAVNGDVANKIGTYPLALAAHAHGVPFLVCAPSNTIDPASSSGGDIPIETRGRDELARAGSAMVIPEEAAVFNPAFDITPRALVTHYVTDRGVVSPPFSF